MFSTIPPLVLNIPIILTLIAVTRYIVGFKTWRNYPTLVLAVSLFLLYSIAESIGVSVLIWTIFTLSTLLTAVLAKHLLRRLKVNYYARIAIIYLVVTAVNYLVLGLLNLTPYFTYTTDLYMGISVLLITSTVDDLATLLYKKDIQEFTRRMVTTVALGFVCGLILVWPWWNSILSRYPVILLFVLLVDVITALWSTLRLTEFIRFGSIIKPQK